MELVEVALSRFPEFTELALLYDCKARCFVKFGDHPRAVEAYRCVFETQRSFPNVKTNAHIGFGMLVATQGMHDFFSEAINVIDEFQLSLPLPAEVFEANCAKALIFHAMGDPSNAQVCAEAALVAASRQHSGLRHHPKLGLVQHPDPEVLKQLKRLAH